MLREEEEIKSTQMEERKKNEKVKAKIMLLKKLELKYKTLKQDFTADTKDVAHFVSNTMNQAIKE